MRTQGAIINPGFCSASTPSRALQLQRCTRQVCAIWAFKFQPGGGDWKQAIQGCGSEEERSWGCGQGEPYGGGATAPAVGDLAGCKGARVGGRMSEVGRKYGMGKLRGVVRNGE